MKRRMYRIIQIFFFIPSSPNKLETFPNKHSTKWPTVILEGIAWGFTTISGLTPIKEVDKRGRGEIIEELRCEDKESIKNKENNVIW